MHKLSDLVGSRNSFVHFNSHSVHIVCIHHTHCSYWLYYDAYLYALLPAYLNTVNEQDNKAQWIFESLTEYCDRVRLLGLPPLFGGGVRAAAATSSAAPSPPTTSSMAASIRERQTGPSNCSFSHLCSFPAAGGDVVRR